MSTRKGDDNNYVRHYSTAAASLLQSMTTNNPEWKLKKAEIYAKLALAAAVERLGNINIGMDLGDVKVDLDLVPAQKTAQKKEVAS